MVSPLDSVSAGTRICGLIARYSRGLVLAAVLGQMDRDHLIGLILQVERDAHPIGGRRAEIGIEFHRTSPGRHVVFATKREGERLVQPRDAMPGMRYRSGSMTWSASGFARSISRAAHARTARDRRGRSPPSGGGQGPSRPGRDRRRSRVPPASATGTTSRRSDRLTRRTRNLRFSSSATARDTLVLCMWLCSPIALPVMRLEFAERDQHAPFRHADAVAFGIEARQRLRDQARHHIELIRQEIVETQRRVLTGAPLASSGGPFYLRRHASKFVFTGREAHRSDHGVTWVEAQREPPRVDSGPAIGVQGLRVTAGAPDDDIRNS